MTTAAKIIVFNRWARPFFGGVLLLAALAGCGGGRSGQGGLIPPGTPTAAAQVEGSAASSPTAAPVAPTASATPTIAEQIAALERSGAYPALDRSTDIAGPDANRNGVRDDIEAWINSLSITDVQRKALMQDARATQQTLVVDPKDKVAVQRVGEALIAATKCGGDSFVNRSDFYALDKKIEAITANTRERTYRYLAYNGASSGSTTSYPSGNTCEP